MGNRAGLSHLILYSCHVMMMLHTDHSGVKENVLYRSTKAKPFTAHQKKRKSNWEMVYGKKSNFKT